MYVDLCAKLAVSPRDRLPEINKTMWAAYAAGQLTDENVATLDAAIAARLVVPPPTPKAPRRVGSRPRSPASLDRRRSWAAAGRMPPTIARAYTLGEQAVLAVVAWEVAKRGTCTLALKAIAGLAGVARSTAAGALAKARANGHIHTDPRHRPGGRNDTSITKIIAPDWCAWIARHPRPYANHCGGYGSRSADLTNTSLLKAGLSAAREGQIEAFEMGNRQARRSRR